MRNRGSGQLFTTNTIDESSIQHRKLQFPNRSCFPCKSVQYNLVGGVSGLIPKKKMLGKENTLKRNITNIHQSSRLIVNYV